MDENQEPAVEPVLPEDSTASPAEEINQDRGAIETPVETQESPDETPVTERKQTRSEKRLHQLLDKYGEPKSEEAQPPTEQPAPPFWQPQVMDGQELTPEQYKADVTRTAQQIAQLENQRLRAELQQERERERSVSQFRQTVGELERQYPALNPDSSDYDDALSSSVSKLYDQAAGGKANADLLKTIAETVMTAARKAAVTSAAQAAEQLSASQASQAIQPTGATQSRDYTADEIKRLQRENPGKLAAYLAKKLTWSED